MVYTQESIKEDLLNFGVRDFYLKYLLRSDNWYFENILEIDEKDIIHAVDDFKLLVSNAMDIGFNNVVMVGSAKIGYSLSPKKRLKTFTEEGENKSDIDLHNIEECRMEWLKLSNESTRQLQRKMYFRHEIHYRIYRDWKDMEEYHIQSIEYLKGVVGNYGK